MNAKVFINYRREDTAPYAGRLYDRLSAHFGEDQVFIDIDQIEPGEDFVEAINRKVSACDIAIVAIGPDWLGATDASGKRRLDDEEDFVRMEIVAALQRRIRVIPVLVGGAEMPRKQDLPEALAPLSRRNAIELSETRFHADVDRLIDAIEKSLVIVEPALVRAPDPTTPMESTPRAQATRPVPSTKPELWTSVRVILVSAVVLLLLGLAWFLMKPGHQNAPRITPNPLAITPNAARVSTPAEAQSADQGNAAAQFRDGWHYERGDGVPKDFGKAAELYQKAADQGYANAQASLGLCYEKGRGVPEDLGKAAELYQKAADQGNANAQYHLGVCYEKGRGVRKDLGRAAEFYQKAADQGHASAQANLGRLYEMGQGVPKGLGKAIELYQKAADGEDVRAQYHLGRLYEVGLGVPKDLGKARALYQKAADHGYEPAITQLRALSR